MGMMIASANAENVKHIKPSKNAPTDTDRYTNGACFITSGIHLGRHTSGLRYVADIQWSEIWLLMVLMIENTKELIQNTFTTSDMRPTDDARLN